MLININTDTLLQSKLTAHQFLIALYMSQGKFGDLEAYLEQTSSVERVNSDLDWLWKKGFIMELSFGPATIPTDYQVTRNFLDLISSKEDFFDELYREYPVKVIRPDGATDYLRADRQTSKRIYALFTKGDKQVHDHIMNCLRFELRKRRASNSLNYMKRLTKWLSSREWESYEDEVNESSAATNNEGEHRYGTELG
jgi:hypothetical protein